MIVISAEGLLMRTVIQCPAVADCPSDEGKMKLQLLERQPSVVIGTAQNSM